MILFRYFAKEIFLTMFAVVGIVLVISMGWRFGGYLDRAAAGLMTPEVLFALMGYRMPGFLELILPLSFFLSIMLVYGRLHVDNEMVVLQSSGLSPARLVGLTLIMAMIVMIMTATIALWLKPLGERQVEALLRDQKTLTEFDTLAPGRFQMLDSGQRVTYAGGATRDGDLSRIFINEYQQSGKLPGGTVTVIAESGKTQVDGMGRRFLVLKDGTRYRGNPGEKNYRVITYEEYGQLIEKGNPVKTKKRRTAIPTAELFGASDPEAVSELHWRISIVLMIPIIALMAVPLSKVNPREGRFTRLVPAMIICFLYIISLSGARSGIEKQDLPMELGLWWVHGIFIIIALLAFQIDRFSDLIARITGLGASAR